MYWKISISEKCDMLHVACGKHSLCRGCYVFGKDG